jgi:hypothetical protein
LKRWVQAGASDATDLDRAKGGILAAGNEGETADMPVRKSEEGLFPEAGVDGSLPFVD